MTSIPDSALRIIELEARQDEALRQLADLEAQLESVLSAALPPAASPLIAPTAAACPEPRKRKPREAA